MAQLLGDRYPTVDALQAKQVILQIGGGKLSTKTTDMGSPGMLLRAGDGLTVAQFRADGFTLNRLQPYTQWDELIPEVERLWPLYVERARPAQLLRIALRYINRLKLPIVAGDDFAEFLTSTPDVPDGLPQTISSFLTRVVLHDDTISAWANVTQSLGGPASSEQLVAVLFDVDVFRVEGLSLEFGVLRPILEALRDFKNRIFFSHLTERTLRLYE